MNWRKRSCFPPMPHFIDAVAASIARQLEAMPRKAVIRASLENRGALIQVRDLDEACAIANHIAPEHLELSVEQPEKWLEKIRHAGAIFLGRYTSEALGDYCAGPNHVLPTSRTARFSSPLGVYDFQKRSSVIQVPNRAQQNSARSLPSWLMEKVCKRTRCRRNIGSCLPPKKKIQLPLPNDKQRAYSHAPNPAEARTSKSDQHNAESPDQIIRPEILALSAYHVPPASGMVKLDAMENPYSLPPELRDEIARACVRTRRLTAIPMPALLRSKPRCAKRWRFPDGMDIMLGNGSDEIIQIIALAFARPGAVLMSVEPAFVMFRMIATFAGMDYAGVPLNADFSLDLDAMLDAIAQHQPAVIFIAYPNNPTGNLFDSKAISRIIEAAPGIVVVDEAYHAFADASFMGKLRNIPICC